MPLRSVGVPADALWRGLLARAAWYGQPRPCVVGADANGRYDGILPLWVEGVDALVPRAVIGKGADAAQRSAITTGSTPSTGLGMLPPLACSNGL
ncbi:MAG: hypothetical protein NZ874_03130 [Fimbriimonadales bacterium]|nr:hypothetical protein [Fimbriimonadales bacterium]